LNLADFKGIQVNETEKLSLAKTRRGLGGPDDWRIIISPMISSGSPVLLRIYDAQAGFRTSLCFARINSVFEMNNIQRENVAL
jgi:hypothetical protein